MAKVKLVGRHTRMVFGQYMHEGHVLNVSDSQARTLEGDADFVIVYADLAPAPLPASQASPQMREEHPNLEGEKAVVKKRRGKKK